MKKIAPKKQTETPQQSAVPIPHNEFDRAAYAWKSDIDYRERPEYYQVGKGEQGALICEPYKSELLEHWRFRTPAAAKESSTKIYSMFLDYLSEGDFVGADLARKFLQMGFTRARRYANYSGGQKYSNEPGHAPYERGGGDPSKAESASIFYSKWQKAEHNDEYACMKTEWKRNFG